MRERQDKQDRRQDKTTLETRQDNMGDKTQDTRHKIR